jgi:CO/xanthine dehydrogenase Mo-binding subunit
MSQIKRSARLSVVTQSVYHATGVRVRELPLMPDKLIFGMKRA